MKWIKLGNFFCPQNLSPWMISHASNSVAEYLYEDFFRIYFNCRDSLNRSHIGFADIELIPPFKIRNISERPVLAPGEIGTFDDSGVSISCIKYINGKKYLYYLGWNLGVTVPWRNSIGLAIYNEQSGIFERFSQAPIMDRNLIDPYSISYPFVLFDNGRYRMWYGSNLKWGNKQEDMAHIIKYAESKDGINWKRDGIISINFKESNEYALSRPMVLKESGIYKMWYSYRGINYRIGYAESDDGISWVRKDESVGISISANGWDSESIEYPFVFDHKNRKYMLYNGNEYGKTGVGIAILG